MSLPKRIRRGVKATFAAEIAHLGAQAGIILLLTRVFLAPDEYGSLFFAIAVFSIVTLFGTLGVPKSTATFLAKYRETDETQVRYIVRISAMYISVTGGSIFILFFIFGDSIASLIGNPDTAPLFTVGSAYILVHIASTYLSICFQGLGRVPLSATQRALSNVAQLVCIALCLLFGFGAIGALVGFIAGYAIGVGYGTVALSRIVSAYPPTETPEPDLARQLFEYSLPLTATRGANILYKRVDTLMVGFFLTPAAVGFYELAKQVSTFVIAPAESLGFSVAPTFGEHSSSDTSERAARVYEQSLEYIVLVYLPATVGIVLLAEPGIEFVFGDAYLGAVPVLQVFSGFIFFQAVDKVTNDSLDYLGRAKERAIGKGVTGGLNFLLNLALIPSIGVAGAAVSTVVCFGLMVLFNVYLIDRELELDRRRLARSIVVTSVITGAMTTIVIILEPYVGGLVTLLGVIGIAVFVWGSVSVAIGFVDPREMFDNV